MSTRLPMFPLGTVLVPHAVLPLHVFEPRYRVLMFDCLRGDKEFGVVLIERGSEVGGEDQRFRVATVARIDQAAELPDGRWVLLAMGTRRVEVVEWLADDPYPVALVEERPESPWPWPLRDAAGGPGGAEGVEGRGSGGGPGGGGGGEGGDGVLARAERAVRRTLALAAKAGEEVASPLVELSAEPHVAAWQLLAVAPIASLDKQALLAVDDHEKRLRRLLALAEDQSLLLAYRLNQE